MERSSTPFLTLELERSTHTHTLLHIPQKRAHYMYHMSAHPPYSIPYRNYGFTKVGPLSRLSTPPTPHNILIFGWCVQIIYKQYSGISDNGLPLLQKPPQCGQEAAVPNHSLYLTVHSNLRIAETSLFQITDSEVTPQRTKSIQISF